MTNQNHSSVQMRCTFDPYLYKTLMGFKGKHIVVQTTRNPLQGLLKEVMPDHLIIEIAQTPFYVRSKEIIWVSKAK